MTAPDGHVEGLAPKRRKVRKGTQSCWECRRRKVRCIFTAPTDPICNNCERRKTTCISQELPDTQITSPEGEPAQARLGRIEGPSENETRSPSHHPSGSARGDSSPALPSIEVELDRPRKQPPLSPVTCDDVSRALLEAWPCRSQLDVIHAIPIGTSAHINYGFRRRAPSPNPQTSPLAKEMIQPPPPSSHPVLIARSLLILGTFLQGLPYPLIKSLIAQGLAAHAIMTHAVDTAVRYVTGNDDLVSSVEGVECILMEAAYHNYSGSLHRAWVTLRRAITFAQVMAVHRGLSSPTLKFVDALTRAAFDPSYMSFRLAQMDRYLSLMLGLPPAYFESSFDTINDLERVAPTERLQRIHCDVAGRILQRNFSTANDLTETHEIDMLLHKAARVMPPQWWIMPDFRSPDGNIHHELFHFNDQLVHYHCLIRLHLPGMLRSDPDGRYNYSRITAVNASRETLTRYISFRAANPTHFYCRGSDFLAFISCTVLCLAHTQAHGRNLQVGAEELSSNIVNCFLTHGRPSDRGMMERSLQIIESMNSTGDDTIALKISRLLQLLLDIEASAADGSYYSSTSSIDDDGDPGCDARLTKGGKVLRIHIPHFGTINIEREPTDRTIDIPSAGAASEEGRSSDVATNTLPLVNTIPRSEEAFNLSHLFAGPVDERTENHNEEGLLSNGLGIASQTPQLLTYDTSDWTRPHPLDADPYSNPLGSFSSIERQSWDTQDVDLALFDSLFCGTTQPLDVQNLDWPQ